MSALSEQFITEARELIQQAVDDLIAAEREGFSDERIDRVFRAFHTLKGSAGVVDLPAMGLIVHAAEDVLAAIQSGRLAATSVVIDRALACLDLVAKWVDDFEADESLPTDAGAAARRMAEELRSLPDRAATGLIQPLSTRSEDQALPDWAHRLMDSQSAKIALSEAAGQLVAVSYEPRPGCFFDGDDPLELMRRVPRLIAFHMEPREAPPSLAEVDPFSCNLRLLALSAATHAELSTLFRLVPDQVRILDIEAGSLPSELGARPASVNVDAVARAVIEEQAHILRASGDPGNDPGRIGSAMRAAANALRHGRREGEAKRVEEAGAAAISRADASALLTAIDEVLSSWKAGPQTSELPGQPTTRSGGRSLRVDEARVDELVDLAGELLVVKNSFAHLAQRIEADGNGHETTRALRAQNDALERIAGELHGAALRLRMVPVAQVFRSFPRLVRDMSQQLGKTVNLVTRGGSTEADKTVVDLLFEPLMHLVRNALDHGIESAEQRSAAGKPAAAAITLEAGRKGDRLVVEVTDDGRGIDPMVIRAKAAEKGLLPADELAGLSDEQALDLIFAAGFSTASAVSDISGRGVGMDVVRTAIERVGGRVSLRSHVGAGTTVALSLPMNIALLRIMVVEAGGQVFGVPMDAVAETVRLTPDRITRIKNNEGFVQHNRIVPICSLAELLNLAGKPESQPDVRLVLITEAGGKTAALEVDAIRDRLEVVLKPMHGLLSGARGYSGTTLLGDGAVLLVLDVKEILP